MSELANNIEVEEHQNQKSYIVGSIVWLVFWSSLIGAAKNTDFINKVPTVFYSIIFGIGVLIWINGDTRKRNQTAS